MFMNCKTQNHKNINSPSKMSIHQTLYNSNQYPNTLVCTQMGTGNIQLDEVIVKFIWKCQKLGVTRNINPLKTEW